MTTRVSLVHRLEQRFARPVRLATHWLRLRPAAHAAERIAAYALRVHTRPHFLNWLRDPFENHLARLDLPEPVTALDVEVALVVDLAPMNPFAFLLDADAVSHPLAYTPQLGKELAPCLQVAEVGPGLAPWLAGLEREPCYVVDRVDALNRMVHGFARGEPGRVPDGAVDLEAVLARRSGSPWELAWLVTVGLRALGLAARFVSGYRVVAASEPAAAHLHAWSEVFLPGAGWVGLDPSAGIFTDETYVPLACAPDPLRTRPVAGFREACAAEERDTLTASVLSPAPRAWPYGETDWTRIGGAVAAVDRALAAGGTRLVLGRELTFVSATDPGAPEWTTAALGPAKRGAAEALCAALRARLAPAAVVQTTSGEWFAGEPVPRWRLLCVWRADGAPVWRHPELLDPGRGPAVTRTTAETVAAAVARGLGVSPSALVPAHEDALHRLWREGVARLARPDAHMLADPGGRRALAETMTAGAVGPAVGWVLPLAWDAGGAGWRTGGWRLRRGRLCLLEGTLPLGERLPLASIGAADGDENAPRTAMCVEVRDGRLAVYLPPLDGAEPYLRLVAAIEDAACALAVPVAIEGYAPPEDPRLRRIVLEPDAGVLRMTLPPGPSLAAHVALLEEVYAQAERTGLVAERRTDAGPPEPVGAGSTIVLGGPEPAESPWLQRPELLRALIVHWQRHPSLSYCLATRAVGPGGLAPRPDEGRPEALYELGLGLDRVPAGEVAQPWLPDRLLRHLLTDRAGDLSRAEFAIGDLFAPEDARGRLGRVALRAFETPPSARMAGLQSLLVAALVARFARDPRVPAFERWGAALRDRWLLPAVLWADLRAVLDDLAAHDLPVELGWFEPFLERQFPLLGLVQIGDLALEVRDAHEPWPVLAEAGTGSGMVRFVDSANQRLQVRAAGLAPGRYVLACNGRRVPLHATMVLGEYVGGVRYKSSCPPATLHPTVPATAALVFDLIDTWSGRACGGCRVVPASRPLAGPLAMPAASPDVETERGPRPRTSPPWFPRHAFAGRFVPTGTGVAPMAPPPPEVGDGYVLDLTMPPA